MVYTRLFGDYWHSFYNKIIDEDDAESKYPAKKKKIVLMKAKQEILDEGGAESVEADTDMDTRKDTEGAAGEDTEAKPDIGDEERESASSVGDDSDSDIMTPDRYDRQAEEDAKYQDQLGIIIEDDDEEEKKEVSFVICFSSLSSHPVPLTLRWRKFMT